MVVDHRAQQVVCRADGVHIAGEVQVDVLHRDDLRVAAACRAALDAEYRTEGRLTQCDHGLLAHLVERLTETDRRGGLALTGRRRVDCGDQNELAVRTILDAVPDLRTDLRLIFSVVFQIIFRQADLCGDLADGLHLAALSNFDVG